MTTNIDLAAEVMREAHDKPHWSPMHRFDNIAQALADAGLLMPDLPAPRTVDRYPGSVCWEVCTDPTVAARRHIGVRVDHSHKIKVNIVGESTPAEAREAAYALLAAATHAEQEQSNE